LIERKCSFESLEEGLRSRRSGRTSMELNTVDADALGLKGNDGINFLVLGGDNS
jgi:hypothetical protein